MKVSKRQLRAIIKEEKAKLLNEHQLGPMVSPQPINKRHTTIHEQTSVSDALGKVHDAIDALITALGPDEALLELQGIVDEMSDTRSLSPDSWKR